VSPASRVFIIGAGPGDPGLLTVRGARLLAQADVVVYDRAAEPVLRWAAADAERIEAGQPAEREVAQDAISMLLAEKARDGHVVARLKWGDPFVFDSGAKEAMFLHEQGIPFEVVPGLPAGVGSAAYAGVPLTHPDGGDALVFIRGDEGRAPDDAAALVYRGTQPSQQTVAGTIAELLDLVGAGDVPMEPAWLIVGEVVALRQHLRWFDERPLFGKRIVITRSIEHARELTDVLENLGAEAIVAPVFRVTPPEDAESVDRAAADARRYDWIVFESAISAARFLAAIARGPQDLRALGRTSLCAVGPSTAEQVVAYGLKPDVVVPELRVEGVAEAMASHAPVDGRDVLVVRPDHERNLLAGMLAERGARVTDLVAYRTEPDAPDSPAAQRIYRMMLDGQIDAVTFTSPTAVRRFASLIGDEQAADLLGTTVVAAIGPVTAAAALELGITPTVVADPYTVEGLVQGLVRHFGDTGPGA
jgi:uroporphyrinogen III methyltransferase/synthase